MESKFWISAVFFISQLLWANGDENNESEIEKKILQKIFMVSKFHMYIKPEQKINETIDTPLQVTVSVYIINTEINIKNKECTMNMYFRQEWNDSRLTYDNQGKIDYLKIHEPVGFWTPDLFFVNENSGHHHMVTKPNTFVRIYPAGKVLYSQRLSVKLNCAMDLRKYPFDTQICKLPIESYGYTAKDLILKWKPDITFGKYEYIGYKLSYSTIEEIIYVGENSYSRLELWIHFSRLIHTQLLHVYIPLIGLVALSWISFWLKPSCYLPRLTTVIITTFSSLIFLQSVKEFFYFNPYPTALDVWAGFCCLLIFAAAFENIYVLTMQNELSSPKTDGVPCQIEVPELQKGDAEAQRRITEIFTEKLISKGLNIDGISRLIFPSAFILFNVIYLAYYLI